MKRALIALSFMIALCLPSIASAASQEVKIACADNIPKADPKLQASMIGGTVVGFVVGGAAGGGDPSIIITGAYVGCETGKAFAEAYKTDGDRAMVLLNPYMFAFLQTKAGQQLIVFAGKIGQKTQDDARKSAEEGAKTGNPLEAAFRAVVTPDGAVNPIGNATGASLAAAGLDPKTAATIGIIVNPTGVVAQEIIKQTEPYTDWTRRSGHGCFGAC